MKTLDFDQEYSRGVNGYQQSMSDNPNQMFTSSGYYGESTTENSTFNTILKEFSLRVSIIYSLQTSGEISQNEAYLQLAKLWQSLEQSANS